MIDEICLNSISCAEINSEKYKFSYIHYPENGLNRYNFNLFLFYVICMGLYPRSDYFSYWTTDTIFSEFKRNWPISRNTFSSILTFWYTSNTHPDSVDLDN